MLTGKNYIGFELSAIGTKTYKTFNPQKNIENETIFYEATQDEIMKALTLANASFSKYKLISGKEKAVFLRTIADEILALDSKLAEVYCSESGLPQARFEGERARTMGQLTGFAQLLEEGSWVEARIDTEKPDRKPIPKVDLRKMLFPIGPIVVFGSSNFPLAYSTAGGDTASALAAGCPVIVKSHPMHAGTSELVASAVISAAKKTNMPEGIFSNLNSAGIEVGQELVKNSFVKGVGFTGSIKGGRALLDLAAQRKEPIPVFAEMGSVNPVVFLPSSLDGKEASWAKEYANSINLGAGQFCTNPGLIFGIKSSSFSKFYQNLAEEISNLDSICMLHPNIHKLYEQNKGIVISQNEVEVLAKAKDDVKENYGNQTVAKTSGENFLKNLTLHQEVFGPFSLIVECKDQNELKEILNHLEGQLTGSLIAKDENEIKQYYDILLALQNRVGRVIFNGVPTGVEVCPSMMHGGPYPSSTDSRFSAVGIDSIKRWVRPVGYQSFPNSLFPNELKDENPLGIYRLLDGVVTKNTIS